MKTGDVVIYIDVEGKEHNALVGAISDLDPARVSLLYLDENKPHEFNSGAHENVIHRLVDIQHASATARQVHVWRELPFTDGHYAIEVPEEQHEE